MKLQNERERSSLKFKQKLLRQREGIAWSEGTGNCLYVWTKSELSSNTAVCEQHNWTLSSQNVGKIHWDWGFACIVCVLSPIGA